MSLSSEPDTITGATLPGDRTGFVSRSFKVDFLVQFSVYGIASVLQALASILVARLLGPEGKGIVVLAATLFSQATLFAMMGAETGFIHYTGNRQLSPTTAILKSIRLGLVFGLLATSAIVIASLFLFSNDYSPGMRTVVYLYAATAPLAIVGAYIAAVLVATGRIVEYALMIPANKLMYIVLLGIALGLGLGATGVITALLITVVLSTTLILVVVIRVGCLQRGEPRSSGLGSKRVVLYGLKSHLGSIMQKLNYRVAVFIVAAFLSLSQVGIYSVALTMSELPWLISNAAGVVVMQRIASNAERLGSDYTARISRLNILITGSVVIALLVTSKYLIVLAYGPAFETAWTALLVLLPGVLVFTPWKVLTNDVIVRGHPEYKSYTVAVSFVMTIVLQLVLVPRWGIIGAATASTLGYALATLTMLHLYSRLVGIRYSRLLIPTAEDFSLLLQQVTSAWTYVRHRRRRQLSSR